MNRTVTVLAGLLVLVVVIAVVFALTQSTKPIDPAAQTQVMQTVNAAAIGTAKANNP